MSAARADQQRWIFACFLGVFHVVLILWTQTSQGASFKSVPPPYVESLKGDVIIAEIQPSEDVLKVEWWLEGKIYCKEFECKIDTSNFSSGEYHFQIMAYGENGIAIYPLRVSAKPTPPLYKPRKLHPGLVSPSIGYQEIPDGDWVIVPRSGVTFKKIENSKDKRVTLSSPQRLEPNQTYQVLSGSQTIVKEVGDFYHWAISSGSQFAVIERTLRMDHGRLLMRTQETADGDQTKKILAQNIKVSVYGRALVGLLVEKDQVLKVKNFEGQSVMVQCPEGEVAVPPGLSLVFKKDKNETTCKVSKDSEEVFLGLLREWSPWWFSEGQPYSADRWRSEQPLWEQSLSPKELSFVVPKFDDKIQQCPNLLDRLTVGTNHMRDDPPVLLFLGRCYYEMGLMSDAKETFLELEESGKKSSYVAFMLGSIYQDLGQNKESLFWYEIAYERKFKPVDVLGKKAIRAATDLGADLTALKWSRILAFNEEGDQAPILRMESEKLNQERPRGARLSFEGALDSHAVAINSESSEGSALVETTRSYVLKLDGIWWRRRSYNGGYGYTIQGFHDFVQPLVTSSVSGQRSAHLIQGGLTYEKIPGPGAYGEAGFLLGSAIMGGERQRDQLGWYSTLAKSSRKDWYVQIENSKFFDPNPNGSDVINIDMDRYTGPGDHSHIDWILSVGGHKYFDNFLTSGKVSFGNVDFRTSSLDAHDHTLLAIEGDGECFFTPKIYSKLEASISMRSFKDGNGQDMSIKYGVRTGYWFAPLWSLDLSYGGENRSVSDHSESSYQRTWYGLRVSVDL